MIRILAFVALFGLLSVSPVVAQLSVTPQGEVLPDTQPLKLDEPLDVVMVRGISNFAQRELQLARERRNAPWLKLPAGSEIAKQGIAVARNSLKEITGYPVELSTSAPVWHAFEQGVPASYGDKGSIQSIRWELGDGIHGIGLFGKRSETSPGRLVIVVPDASITPEQLFGLQGGLPAEEQIARRLFDAGVSVLCPVIIDRDYQWSGHPEVRDTNLPHREYVYRLLFEMGRHPLGVEVAKLLRAVDLWQEMFTDIAIVGIGDGGQHALLAGALDDRIGTVAVSGYFQQRETVWQQPLDRNLFGQLKDFGDAELASLIAPRRLIIEAAPAPKFAGPTQVQGRANIAAPGVNETPSVDSVLAEFQRAKDYYTQAGAADAISLIEKAEAPGGDTLLSAVLPAGKELRPAPAVKTPGVLPETLSARMKSQIRELVFYSQRLMHASDKVRYKSKLWAGVNMSGPEAAAESLKPAREMVHDTFIGRLPKPTAPANVRSRKVIDEPTHIGYEVVLDVYPAHDGTPFTDAHSPSVIAGGILLLPKDLKAGERRPVVVCQHGLEGIPMDTITEDQTSRAWAPYKGFSSTLVKQGYIVYAPQNPYRGYDNFRVIQRQSNLLGRSLFSYIIEQHRQTLQWLGGLPWVDKDRIGFYGLSYGGKTAVRVPPMLPPTKDEVGYCLSICSADYNDWIRKNASAEDRYSYVYTPEYEIFEWNMGHVANYAELSYLMVPRPFMVERGHDDGVAPDEWVAWEYAKVRRLYNKLGIGDRTEIEFFNGPHTINGVGTYEFLKRHLQ